jgi:hypothetical protein
LLAVQEVDNEFIRNGFLFKKVVHGIKYNLIKPHNFHFSCLIGMFYGLQLRDQFCEQQKVGIYAVTVIMFATVHLSQCQVNKRIVMCAKL